MARKNLIRSGSLPYHVTLRVNRRERWPLSLDETWAILTKELRLKQVCHEIEIHAFLLMPNHLHLLISTPGSSLDLVMRELVSYVTRKMNLKSGLSGRVFEGRYKWQLIDSHLYYAHCLKYVYRNPVKAGLCARVEDWPWSTLYGMLGSDHLPLPLSYPRAGAGITFVPEEHAELVDWLNTPYPKEAEEALRKALRRSTFGLPRDAKTTRAPAWLHDALPSKK